MLEWYKLWYKLWKLPQYYSPTRAHMENPKLDRTKFHSYPKHPTPTSQMYSEIEEAIISDNLAYFETRIDEALDFDREYKDFVTGLAAYYGKLEMLEWLMANQFSFDQGHCAEQAKIAIYMEENVRRFKYARKLKELEEVLNFLSGEKSTDLPTQF